jgi:hypothetical protein
MSAHVHRHPNQPALNPAHAQVTKSSTASTFDLESSRVKSIGTRHVPSSHIHAQPRSHAAHPDGEAGARGEGGGEGVRGGEEVVGQ